MKPKNAPDFPGALAGGVKVLPWPQTLQRHVN
jgi:hypothetical protein